MITIPNTRTTVCKHCNKRIAGIADEDIRIQHYNSDPFSTSIPPQVEGVICPDCKKFTPLPTQGFFDRLINGQDSNAGRIWYGTNCPR